jgi:hypothetical protein
MLNSTLNTFKQIRITEITNKELLHSHSIYNVYSGITFPKLSQSIAVYIIELKFLEDVDKFALMQSVNDIEAKQKELIRQTTLKRYAYYTDGEYLNLVYLAESYEFFEMNSFIEERQQFNNKVNEKLIKFELVRQLLEYTKLLHDNGIALQFIHPNLFFYNIDNGFVFFDYIIGIIIKETFVKLPKQYDLSNTFINHFGIFHHHERKRVLANKAINKDIFLLLIYMSYIFSKVEYKDESTSSNRNKLLDGETPQVDYKTKSRINYTSKNLYEVILFNFQRDYLREGSGFTCLVKLIPEDNDVRDFITKYCVHRYENSTDISTLYSNFLNLFNSEIRNYFIKNTYEVCLDCGLSEDGNFEDEQQHQFNDEKMSQSNITLSESEHKEIMSQEDMAKKFQAELDESIKDFNEEDEKVLAIEGVKNMDNLDRTISLKNEELSNFMQTGKKKENKFSYFLNKHCFDLICVRCCKNHECEFLKQTIESDTKFEKYLKCKERVDEMMLLYSLSGKIEPKNFTSQYKEKGIYTKFLKIAKGHQDKEVLVKKHEEYIHFLLKNLDKILKGIFDEERNKFEKRFAKATLEMAREPIRPDMEKILDEVVASIERFNALLEHVENVKRTFRGHQAIFHSFNNIKIHAENYAKRLKSLYLEIAEGTKTLQSDLVKLIRSKKDTYVKDESFTHPFFNELQLEDLFKHKYLVYPNIVQHCFNITTPEKDIIKELPFPKLKNKNTSYINFKLVHLKSKFLVTGGKRDQGLLNEAYYCNYISDYTFCDLPPMNTPRDNHAMTVYNDIFVLVIGGTNTNTCEKLNLLDYKKGWTKLPNISAPRSEAAVMVYNNSFVYLFCGMEVINNFPQFSNKIERLHLHILDRGWEILDPTLYSGLPKMKNMGLVTHKNNILILGGLYETEENNTNQIFKFDCEAVKLGDSKNMKSYDKKVKFIYDTNLYRINDNTYVVYGNDKQSLFKLSYDRI